MKIQLNSRKLGAAVMTALLSVSFFQVAAADPLSDKIAKDGTLTIGIHNRWPWGVKAQDEKVSGVHPDVVNAVAQSLGVKDVKFVVMEFGALIPNLASRRIDAAASGLAITPERCKQVSFSEPFLTAGDAALVKAGNPLGIHSYADIAKNPKIRVGDARGAITTTNAVASGVEASRIQPYQDYNELIAGLLADRVDVIFMTSGTALGYMNDPNIKGIERATPFVGKVRADGKEEVSYTAIAFRPEDANFRDRFNKSLATKIADGSVWTILKKYGFQESELVKGDVTAETLCQGNYR